MSKKRKKMTKIKKLDLFSKKLSKIAMIAILSVFIFITANAQTPSGEVVTLLGYLHVFPEDLGAKFYSISYQEEMDYKGFSEIIAAINTNKVHGYDTWRLPTKSELEIMDNNREKLGLKKCYYNDIRWCYMSTESEDGRDGFVVSYNVRLVTAGEKIDKQITQNKQQAEDDKQQKLKDEIASWSFEVSGTDIPNIEANNRGSACPSGWRLPTEQEMKLITSNSITSKDLGSSVYWISGSTKESYNEYSQFNRGVEGQQIYYVDRIYIYPVYDVRYGSTTITKKYVTERKSYYSTWESKQIPASSTPANDTKYLPCRCVRNK